MTHGEFKAAGVLTRNGVWAWHSVWTIKRWLEPRVQNAAEFKVHCFLVNGTFPRFATGNTDSANKVAEKLEELSVKDKASEEKKEGEKKETEKKDEKEVVKDKNWNPRTCFCWSSIYRFFLFFYNRL